MTAYVLGAPNYKTITWDELQEAAKGRSLSLFSTIRRHWRRPLTTWSLTIRGALQGEFFKHKETLQEYRRILTLCDFIYLIPVPLGVSAYAKSGNADFPANEYLGGFHARSFAGGMYCAGRWVYFAFIINWYADEAEDPKTVEAFFAAIHHTLEGFGTDSRGELLRSFKNAKLYAAKHGPGSVACP